MAKPIEAYGYNSVGPGWRFILEAMDTALESIIGSSTEVSVEVLQVKEKFGGLRVYLEPKNFMSSWAGDEINGVVRMAEILSLRFCERCGSTQDVETRGREKVKFSWVQTLCGECHKKRDKGERI